jgi:hypothetical protein
MIDFSKPCVPDVHAQDEAVQRAASKIRREIQARHTAWQAAELYGVRRYAPEIAIQRLNAEDAAALKAEYDVLFSAYGRWAHPSGTGPSHAANPKLLATVVASTQKYFCSAKGVYSHLPQETFDALR